MSTPPLATARSFLFVPGNRPERFDKAAASGADLVILDLEDAVSDHDKPAAREHVVAWLRGGNRGVVRINGAASPWHDEDVSALAGTACLVMVPKAENASALSDLSARLGCPLVALVETARGVTDVTEVAMAAGVERLALGTIDLAAELGVDPNHGPALDYSRGRVVVASAAAGLPQPIDGVTTKLDDLDLLLADTRRARALGFGAKLCIHPRQIEAVHDALRPEAREVEWARSVVDGATTGVSVVDGGMVDAPVLARARMILGRAGN